MGIYLVGVHERDWRGDDCAPPNEAGPEDQYDQAPYRQGQYDEDEDEDDEGEDDEGQRSLAAALDAELARRGLPPYSFPSEPAQASGPPPAGRWRRRAWWPRPTGQGRRRSPAPEPGFEEKLVAGPDGFTALCAAHLTPAEHDAVCGWTVLVPLPLTEALRLPVTSSFSDEAVVAGAEAARAAARRLALAVSLPAEVPSAGTRLALTAWFLDGGAAELARARPGPWSRDLDAAFHIALYLRAAEYALRHGCPIRYA
ncbi:hypothetical protein [Streptomyces sp. NPDC093225]|uniref:hypothetical protein n=1 Tax=Streptomyces sp. NPDC093225 TaxID=3366034 RepID=UPI00382CCFF9